MWKIAGYVLLWIVGSTAAVAVAWTGVAVVDDDIVPASVFPDRSNDSPESASAVPENDLSIGATRSTRTTSTGTDGSPTSSSEQESERSIGPVPTADSSSPLTVTTRGQLQTSSSSGGSSSDGISQTSGATSRTTTTTSAAPTATTATTAAATTATTTPATAQATAPATTASTAAPSQTKTYVLVGGSTAISFSAAGTQVLWATPKPGFDVDIGSGGPGVRVEFESDDQESRIDAWWDNGPRQDIRER